MSIPEQATAYDPRVQLQSAIATANPTPDFRPLDPVEIEKLRAGWQREQRAVEREHNHRRAELIRMRSQLHLSQQALEMETRARRIEAAQSSSRIATLERQLADANAARVAVSRLQSKEKGARIRLSAAAATAAVILSALVAWTQFPAGASAVKPETPAVAARSLPKFSVGSSASQEGFPRAMSRLNEALAAFPAQTPESIFREVRKQDRAGDKSLCAFQWNGGQPALLYGGGGGLSLSTSLTRCAEAVERLKR